MKSAIIRYRELEEKIIKEINESNLSAFVIMPIIEKIYKQLYDLSQKEYEEALKEEGENND